MRKFMKKSILEIFQTMYEAHRNIKQFIEKKNFENANIILGDCQNTAIQIGEAIESSEGEGFVTVSYLEEYCEAVYEVSSSISDNYNGNKAQKVLDKLLIKAENSVKNDIKVRLEIVFCPYKASMWDSLESVWKAADEDPDCDAYVVPIPYYDRNPDHSFGEFHYEGGDYPDYVHITHYEAYNFETRRPDVVYIHNPYDQCNYVTSVDPRFYSSELKKYTYMLIYVPYFVTGGTLASSFNYIPSYINYNYIITQSENIHKYYNQDKLLQNKLTPLGSPKFDRVIKYNKYSRQDLPYFETTKDKTVIFCNFSISSLLEYRKEMFDKLEYIINEISENNKAVLLLRPHPLAKATITSMCPSLLPGYETLMKKAAEAKNVILDDFADIDKIIAISDAYVGEETSSVVHLFGVCGKPVFLIDREITESTDNESENISMFDVIKCNGDYWSVAGDRNSLIKFDENGQILETYLIPGERCDMPRLYNSLVFVGRKIIMAPYTAEEIAVFDIDNKSFTKLPVPDRTMQSFVKCFVYEGEVYMVPCKHDMLLKLNPDSLETTYYRDFYRCADNKIPKEKQVMTFNSTVVDNGILYVALAYTNKVLMYDLKNNTKKTVAVGSDDYWCMAGENGRFVLGANNGNSLIFWNANENKCRKLSLPEGFEGQDKCFYKMVLFRHCVYVFPKTANMILKVDLNSLEVTSAFEYMTSELNKRKNHYYNWASNTLTAELIGCNEIVCQFANEYGLDFLSENGRKHIDVKLSEQDTPFEFADNCSRRSDNIPWAIRENQVVSFRKFIEYVNSGKHNKTHQIAEYSYSADNLDGTSGEKIHRFVMNKVI